MERKECTPLDLVSGFRSGEISTCGIFMLLSLRPLADFGIPGLAQNRVSVNSFGDLHATVLGDVGSSWLSGKALPRQELVAPSPCLLCDPGNVIRASVSLSVER